MEQNKVIDIIIEFINGIKGGNKIVLNYKGEVYRLYNSKYLLNQIIRQYSLEWSHYYFSKKAFELWQKISTQKWTKTFYRAKVICDIGDGIEIEKFKGSAKNGVKHTLSGSNDWFYYREVFHDEHMITISDIINELVSLEVVNRENVIAVLDKIYICRMLKTEDRLEKPQRKRGLDLDYVINEVYKPCGIEVINYNDLPASLKE